MKKTQFKINSYMPHMQQETVIGYIINEVFGVYKSGIGEA